MLYKAVFINIIILKSITKQQISFKIMDIFIYLGTIKSDE